jgi:hypothetical protein
MRNRNGLMAPVGHVGEKRSSIQIPTPNKYRYKKRVLLRSLRSGKIANMSNRCRQTHSFTGIFEDEFFDSPVQHVQQV